jgi:hypothetical protein
VGAALKASLKLEDNEPQDHDHNSAHNALMKPVLLSANAEDPSIVEQGAELGTCTRGCTQHIADHLKLHQIGQSGTAKKKKDDNGNCFYKYLYRKFTYYGRRKGIIDDVVVNHYRSSQSGIPLHWNAAARPQCGEICSLLTTATVAALIKVIYGSHFLSAIVLNKSSW